ncbi:caspase family protein [Tolypothrix sp. FACHB-123]|uniref:caspase family protein n=1 Tax=Tolypothrix sp. FACHB-123 TaxID=2692868 RepID=UPI001681E42E|nr:caspase family protein [Tolypothrix sp. FACHB-123]MBD2359523.1 caspase family protein [Tolypothrix sp. FACHB-123]
MARNFYALLVGIDSYPNPIHSLQGCVNDMTAMAEYLNNRFFQEGYQLHLKMLTNQEATRQAIIDGFRMHLCQARSNDLSLFYFSGHGSQQEAQEEFWHLIPSRLSSTLVCYDSRTEGGKDLIDWELAELIYQVGQENPQIILILDSVHAGFKIKPLLELIATRQVTAVPTQDIKQNLGQQSTNWMSPKLRYIFLAACRDIEIAKEINVQDGQKRGVFSYFLLDTLQRYSKRLTYRDLIKRTNALVRSKVVDQSPQIETADLRDLDQLFPGGEITEHTAYFTVSHDIDHGWVIDGGAVHGVQPPVNDETTLLVLFNFDADSNDLRAPSKSVGTAKVTQVLSTKSKIDIEGVKNLTTDSIFKAFVISLPLPLLKVYFEGDKAGINLAREQIKIAGLNGTPSAHIHEEEEIGNAELRLLCRNNQYIVLRSTDERPLVAQIDGYTPESARKTIQCLEHIARWMAIVNLSYPTTTMISPGEVEMVIYQEGQELQNNQIRLEYRQENGRLKSPTFKILLRNMSKKPLYCVLLNLTHRFAVSAGLLVTGGIWLKPGEEAWALNGGDVDILVPKELVEQGINEVQNILKLIVSTVEFDATLLEQTNLELPIAQPEFSRNI